MFYVPEFNGSLVHWVALAFLASAPLFFFGEASGWTSFGYSKFADREAKFALPSKLGMFIIYFPAVVLFWVPPALRGVELTSWHLIAGSLVSIHFAKRCLEALFVHRYSGVMNLVSVLMICTMYSSMAAIFGEVAATEVGPGGMPTDGFEVAMRVGLGIWGVGVLLNFHHHRILANLRKPGETGYKLPKGGLFRWVACPHYLAEIVGWWGYTLVFHHIIAPIFAVVMTLYLAGRAHNTVKWYRERLGDEVPTHWKRLIPFVY